ncbi:hypothetical protein PFISCL1PPCAC_5737, partial [Pristionchus fissidentatus]
MQKGWNLYLDRLQLDESSSTCVECGQFPRVIICDGICLGSRADIGSYLPPRGDTVIPTVNPGWMGSKRERLWVREYGKGNMMVPMGLPPAFIPFVESTALQSKYVDPKYTELLVTLFSDSPVTDILKVFHHPAHPDHLYGPKEESELDFYPAWPLVRGLGKYDKDKRRDEMECSRKEIVAHSTLSPGVLLLNCQHRVTYGYTILDCCESPRSVFRVLATRFPDGEMPEFIVYDNSCHPSVYCMSREPALFSGTSFLIYRLHSANHKSCSRTLYLKEYDADPDMKSINSQSCEQTNARLRHINHVLPFLKLHRFKKTLALFLSENQ